MSWSLRWAVRRQNRRSKKRKETKEIEKNIYNRRLVEVSMSNAKVKKTENRWKNKEKRANVKTMTVEYLERVSWGQCWAIGKHSECKRTASHCVHACPGWCPGICRVGWQWLPWPQRMPGPDSLLTNTKMYRQQVISVHTIKNKLTTATSQINQMHLIKINDA